MDTRFKGCLDLWQRKTGKIADESTKQALWSEYNVIKRKAIKDGVSMDSVPDIEDIVDGKAVKNTATYAELELLKGWGQGARSNLLQELQQLAKEAKGILFIENRANNIVENLRLNNPKKAADSKWLEDAKARAIISLINDTNDTFGTIPLDKLYRTEITQYFGDFNEAARIKFKQEFGDTVDFETFAHDRENLPKILTEIFEFEKNRGQHNSPKTGSREAYIIAQEFYRNTTLAHKLNMSKSGGRFLRFNRAGLSVRWNKLRVSKVTRDQFIADVAPLLDDVHGDLLYKQSLAGSMYDDIKAFNDKTSWRTIGDTRSESLNSIADITGTNPRDKGAKILFKDGEAFSSITAKYADEHSFQQLVLGHVTELGREMAILKFTGNASNTAGLTNILNWANRFVDKSQIGAIRRAQLESSQTYLQTLVQPEILEGTRMMPNFQALRNLQAASKLGSAVITALLDIPMFLVTGRTIFNLPIMEMIGKVFRQTPGIGAGDAKTYAKYILEASESWMDAASIRYVLSDGADMGTTFSRGSSKFAHFVFKSSGLNWWTKNLQSSAAGIYGKHLGDLIREGTQYKDFNPKFRENLAKYGIGEAEWAETLARNGKDNLLLDSKGRLDMYKMGTTTSAGIEEIGRQNLRQRYIAAMADAVDTMVMKPSQFDRQSAAFFTKEGTIANQAIRTMTQFKAHPISMMRKVWGRTMKSDQQSIFWTGTGLIAGMMTMGAVTVQLKEFVAGRQPYDASKPDFWIRVAKEAGVAGLAGDMMMDFGLKNLLDEAFGEDKARTLNSQQIVNTMIGPLMADMLNVMTSGIGIGQGVLRYAQGKDDGELMSREFGDILKLFAGSTGLERLWYSKMLYRAFVSEWIGQMFDPDGYERRERRFQTMAEDSKVGRQKDNFVYRGIQDLF